MKTAVSSIRYARQKKSRSELYAVAISEYLARHDADVVTAAMNNTLKGVGKPIDPFIREVTRRTLKRAES